MSGMAQAMAARGDAVTILFVPPLKSDFSGEEAWFQRACDHYLKYFLIKIEMLIGSPRMAPKLWTSERTSFAVYDYLRARDFDVVYFQLEGGYGHYALLAKESGCFGPRPRIEVVAHTPMAWRSEAERFFLEDLGQIAIAHMERCCVEAADGLICSSEATRAWMARNGWRLPTDTVVLPDLRPAEWTLAEDERLGAARSAVDEIVFVGTTDFPSGFALFCNAIDRVITQTTKPFRVTVLGAFGRVLGEHGGGVLLRHARRWPVEISMLPRLTPQERLSYLLRGNCLAVVAPLAADTPMVLTMLLEEGIPFVATDVGGIPEMIARPDRARVLATPTAAALAGRITDTIGEVATPARAALTATEKTAAWTKRLDKAQPASSKPAKAARAAATKPLVSIIIAHHDRPNLLPQAIRSVEQQDYDNIEVIVIDDGSSKPESRALLDSLEPTFKRRRWRILREENRYLGAARNAGIRVARGEFVLFLDDDNILFPQAVSTFVRAMQTSGADISTCFSKLLFQLTPPAEESAGIIHYFPLGGSLDLALFHDSLGDANAMIRREVFDKIGDLVEDYGYACQDWEFFTRALFNQLKLRIIPEPLYWYRASAAGMYRTSNWYDNRLPIIALMKKYKFAGMEYFLHPALAQNVEASERESYQYNLGLSKSDEQIARLREFDPASDEAISALAAIATAEGRPGTALVLMGQAGQRDAGARLMSQLGTRAADIERVIAEASGSLPSQVVLNKSQLRELIVQSSLGSDVTPVAYVEKNDHLYLGAVAGSTSIATLAGGFPAGAVELSSHVYLDQQLPALTEFALLLVAADRDPMAAALSVDEDSSAAVATSGWMTLSDEYWPKPLSVSLAAAAKEALTIVLAVRMPAGKSTAKTTLGCFSYIKLTKWVDVDGLRRPRIDAPPNRKRAFPLSQDQMRSAVLATSYPSAYPLLSPAPDNDGLVLRPSAYGIVVATLAWVFPPLARQAVASVEIADDDASPFEFAMALGRPDEALQWTQGDPSNALAFSGWVRVENKFELHKVTAQLAQVTRMHLSVSIAVRLPPGSIPLPAQSIWRKIVITWEE
jgi:glycosyltransferase involved in cell wall biosynthesis